MELKEMRELTQEELLEKEREAKKELFHLRVQVTSGKVENPARIRQVRRMVARLKTVIREKQTAPRQTPRSQEKVTA